MKNRTALLPLTSRALEALGRSAMHSSRRLRNGGQTWGARLRNLVDERLARPRGGGKTLSGVASSFHGSREAAIAFDRSRGTCWVVGPDGFINKYEPKTSTWVPVTQFAHAQGSGRWITES